MKISGRLCMVFEALLYFHQRVEKKNPLNTIIESLNLCVYDNHTMRSYISDIKTFHKKMAGFMADEEEKLEFYFKNFSERYAPIGYSRAFIIIRARLGYPTPEDFCARMDELAAYTPNEVRSHLLRSLPGYTGETPESSDDVGFDDFMAIVGRLSPTSEQAFAVIDCYANFHKYVRELKEIILNAISYMEQFSELFDNCITLLHSLCTTPQAIKEAFGSGGEHLLSTVVTSEHGWDELVVLPIFCMPITSHPPEGGTLYISPTFFIPRNEDIPDEAIWDIMKCLSDPTRLKIMHEISNTPLTNKQLSEMFGLTAATISHHMTLLSEMGFIFSSSQGLRVFYRSQVKSVLRFVRGLEKYLVGKLDSEKEEID